MKVFFDRQLYLRFVSHHLRLISYIRIIISQQGEIDLEVVFVAPDDDSDDDNAEYEDESGFR